MQSQIKRFPRTAIFAFLWTLLLTGSGYFSFGFWTTFIFAFGFVGGLVLWIIVPTETPFSDFRKQFWLTFAAFLFLHRVEENLLKFQERLSDITGNPVPELNSPTLILLVLASVGGWLAVPLFLKRQIQFGYFLAWSFFASMGITELAHFVLPIFEKRAYGYFPGMGSVAILAPLAWWGMKKLCSRKYYVASTA